jgi:hypothetical protein
MSNTSTSPPTPRGPTQPRIQCAPGALYPGVKITTRLHLLPRLRISRATPPRPHMPSWNAKGQLYFLELPGVRIEGRQALMTQRSAVKLRLSKCMAHTGLLQHWEQEQYSTCQSRSFMASSSRRKHDRNTRQRTLPINRSALAT